MVESAKAFERALLQKGFKLERQTKDKLFCFYHNGQKTEVFTKISHGRSEDLRDVVLSKIKQQLRFDRSSQLRDFIECSLTHEQYIQWLHGKSVI